MKAGWQTKAATGGAALALAGLFAAALRSETGAEEGRVGGGSPLYAQVVADALEKLADPDRDPQAAPPQP